MSRILAGLSALLVAVALTGCGAQADEPTVTGPPRAEIRVGLTEWTIETGHAEASAGTVQLTVTNTGATTHDLVVVGALGKWATPLLASGESAGLTISTEPGEQLHLDCSVTGHHDQGMHTTLPVAGSR